MNTFPDTFNSKYSNEEISKVVKMSDKAACMRENILTKYENAIKSGNEYMVVDFKDCSDCITDMLVKEILDKFTVGVPAENSDVEVTFNEFFKFAHPDLKTKNPENDSKRIVKIKNTKFDPRQKIYIVALTNRFANDIEKYSI